MNLTHGQKKEREREREKANTQTKSKTEIINKEIYYREKKINATVSGICICFFSPCELLFSCLPSRVDYRFVQYL